MSLFSSIQMASNTLQVNDIGLQVVGQNIANANTPGYIREQLNLAPGPTEEYGGVAMGTGVVVQSISQNIDKYLEQRLRTAGADQTSADTIQQTYGDLETTVGALNSSNNLDNALNQFFSSISDVLNQPEDVSARNMAVVQGQTLATTINSLSNQVSQLRVNVNDQISGMAGDINTLVNQIATLNTQIVEFQAGAASTNDTAVGLTDQRQQALSSLSNLIGVQTIDQPDGSVAVYSNGEYLVYEGYSRQVETTQSVDRGITVTNLQIGQINAPLDPASGQLHGLLTSRDQVLGGFEDQLNAFAGTLADEFNKVYAAGQGLTGYTQVTGTNAVADPNLALDDPKNGLSPTPVNGSFQIVVTNTQTGTSQTTTVPVQLLGTGNDTTLQNISDAINKIAGLQASTPGNKLSISSTDPNTQFSFANDTSGALAALGINTFFTGSTAGSLGVNSVVVGDPGKFAASQGGVGVDTANATILANFYNQSLTSQGGNSIGGMYSNLVNNVTQGSAAAQAMASAADTYETSLANQETATSGVSMDEETVQMLAYQQSYQASAKYISTLNNLLEMLVQL
jgi:flagellar hook-associated protein 1 FlgK